MQPVARRVLAPEKAYQWLRATISVTPRDEELFLTEAEIVEQSGQSRTPVREALLRLESEGLIRRIPHKGAYVPAVTDRDVTDLMQARLVIESHAMRRVAADGSVDRLDLDRLIDAQENESDPARFIELDIEFHTRILAAAGNAVLADFYRSLRARQTRTGIGALSHNVARQQQVVDEHSAIRDALRACDPDRSAAAIADHLSATLASLIAAGAEQWPPTYSGLHE